MFKMLEVIVLDRSIIIGFIVCLVLYIIYLKFFSEGFSNKEMCSIMKKNVKLAKEAQDLINKMDYSDSRELINRKLQMRDLENSEIILSEDSTYWCKNEDNVSQRQPSEKSLATIDAPMSDNYDLLFDGPELLEENKMPGSDDHLFEEKYAKF